MKVTPQWTAPDIEKNLMRIARVSSNDPNSDKVGLIGYLIRNKHWSPFETVSMCFRIDGVSRAIARQMIRHRSFTWQELSQRYADVSHLQPEMNQGRKQGEKARQKTIQPLDEETQAWWQDAQRQLWTKAMQLYKEAEQRGVARECRRVLLPEGMTPSTIYMQGTLRSFIHYVALRNDPNSGTQQEHMAVAAAIAAIIKQHCPHTVKALQKRKDMLGWQ